MLRLADGLYLLISSEDAARRASSLRAHVPRPPSECVPGHRARQLRLDADSDTGHVLSFRVARHTPLPSSDLEPLPRERMVVVPTDLLHPDWVASPSEAEVLRSPMTLALDKDVVQGMLCEAV